MRSKEKFGLGPAVEHEPEYKTSGVEVMEMAPEKILSAEELKIAIQSLKDEEELLRKDLGIVTLPAGSKVGDIDVGGKTISEVLDQLEGIDLYEGAMAKPATDEQEAGKSRKIPDWLIGYEELIWHGAHDNPLWEPVAEQHKDNVRVRYVRRDSSLQPGKSAGSQDRSVEPVKNTFSLDEWKVLKSIFDNYLALEEQMGSDDQNIRHEAKAKILEVVKEENDFRKGKMENPPETISQQIVIALDQVAKATRGFDQSKVDVAKLSQYAAEMLSQLLVLNRTRGDGREHMPSKEKMSGIEEYPSFEHTLSKLAASLSQQLEQSQGISYMIGEAGTGKNIAAEYFASQTDRPFFWFPCGRGMESMDLMYHYEFDSDEGTKRFMTDLTKGIQTPGAVVLIDEANALKEPIQAILHGLGDKNRSLNYDAVQIPAAEGVLVVMATNPATYAAAGNLGQALLNRTRGLAMTVDYPALTKGELAAIKSGKDIQTLSAKEQKDNSLREYAADEVLVLYGLIPELNGLSREAFVELWDVIINEHRAEIGQLESRADIQAALTEGNVTLPEVEKILIDLKNIIEIGDTWRKSYGGLKDGFDVVGFSLRDSLAVARRYVKTRDVRQSFLEVYDDFKKNPIDGLDHQYLALKALLDKKLPKSK